MVSLVLSVCLVLVTAGAASARTELVEAYPTNDDAPDKPPEQVQLPFNVSVEAKLIPVGVYDLATITKGTLGVAQGSTEATTDELTTQPAAQAEPDPEALQRNMDGGNAPTWFLIVLGIAVIAVILAVRRLRR
jgi:methionine-rich copper-binding protein CopC